jgi:anti-anti-sigma regulatory factor
MAFEKNDTPRYTHIIYYKESFSDIEVLRRDLTNILAKAPKDRDIVFELAGLRHISSLEISLITMISNAFKETEHTVHVIALPEIKKTLELTGISKLEKLEIHEGWQKIQQTP